MTLVQHHITVSIPKKLTVVDFLLNTSNPFNPSPKNTGLPCFIDTATKEAISHAQLIAQVHQISSSLYHHYSLRRGDVLLIISPNHINYGTVLLAGLDLGLLVTTANPNYTEEELMNQISDCTPKLIFCTRNEARAVDQSLTNLGLTNLPVISMDADDSLRGMVPFSQLLGRTPELAFERLRFQDDGESDEVPALMVYSSGTTGKPKGVVLTHLNVIANLVQSEYANRGREITGRVSLGLLPFYHCYGIMMLLLHNIHNSMTTIVIRRFDFELVNYIIFIRWGALSLTIWFFLASKVNRGV